MICGTRWISLTILACAALAGIGCKQEPQTSKTSSSTASTAAVALPAGLFVKKAPPGARGVAELKADQAASGQIVVHGRIGGRRQPFVDGMALFLLADAKMKSCDQLPGDTCKRPWDYCCEPRESLAASVATVQIVGSDGKPLRVGLQGQHGLEPLATITIAGQVAQRDETGTLIINAQKIYVQPQEG